jgi:pimeloyl-ACP methyl ester carboxylesterase
MFKRVIQLIAPVALLLALNVNPTFAQDKKPTIILVHGAFQDASGWVPVVKALKAKGYTAIAVEWAGLGGDKTPLKEITLDKYRDAVVSVIKKQDQPVILVGHSFGGIVISAVAEAVPNRIKTVMYLAAYLPRNGDSLVTLSGQDKFSVLGKEGNFIVAKDFSAASVRKEIFASSFCPDCNPDQLKTVAASQLDEPLAPLGTPVTLTAKAFGSVRKEYIMTSQDVVVSPQLQALMIANTPMDHVYALDAGHAAYVTVPDALANVIVKGIGKK